MQTVVFLIYHGMGHFNACFRLASILKKDHDVIFAGVEYFTEYMESQGFIYYPLKTVPFGLGFEKWVNEQDKSNHPNFDAIKDRWTDRLYKEREAELLQCMNDLNPDYLLIDSFQSTDFIVLYPYLKATQTKVGFIQTMLPTSLQKDYPPINSLVLPDDKKGIKNAASAFRFERLKKRIKQKIMFFGMDDFTIINRRSKKNKIPYDYRSNKTALTGASFQQIDEFILAPREFEFVNSTTDHDKHYIGFMPDFNRIEISDVEYFKIDSLIREKINQTSGQLIYCSFGSVKSEDTKAVTAFVEKLLEVVKGKNWILIVSLNSIHHNPLLFHTTADNVYFLKAAPQLQILERTDLFITHGGLNSIKESVYAGVPMLVYPLHDTTDTMGNSTRVIYHQLGLRGDLLQDSKKEIHDKITTLLTDDLYKKNIYSLRETDDAYHDKFLELFKKLKPVH